MVKIYYTLANASSKKALQWLKKQKLDYEKINWSSTTKMTQSEFFKILSLTERGTTDILAQKSLAYSHLAPFMNELTLVELLGWVNSNKSLLRLPLIIDDSHLQVGYNEENIRQFIPQNRRKIKKFESDELFEQ
ncbi:ArsC/Spx/MgsR family protein [Lactococcus garvieae]|nr:ArsC/Spx/MgsR family protein [Lactococcus garvieae]QPS70264.1 transcriptional regulator [Lactococcus garvieae]